MTPKVTSIIKKYENSWKMMEVDNPISSEEGCKTMDIKRKKLKEAILLRNKCQVRLHHVNYCHDSLYNPLSHSSHCSNWVTYVVRATGFFQDTKYFLQLPVVCG